MSYQEKRVRVKHYGVLPRKSPLLVEVPSIRRRPLKLHKLAAAAFMKMAEAVQADLGIELKAASCWRRHRWKSWEHYEKKMIDKYGSVKEGRRWVAYNSPHETGLAVDFGVGGLEPSRRTRKKQRKTPLHKWLVEHAHEYGFHPYKTEPWHWEFPIGKKAWESGDPADISEDSDVPIAFGDDDEFDGTIEDEMFVDDALWFADEDPDIEADEEDGADDDDELTAPGPHVSIRASRPSEGRTQISLPKRGSFEGQIEIDGAGLNLRWQVRWSIEG